MSRSYVEIDKRFIEERAFQALEEISLTLSANPEVIDSLNIEEVGEALREVGAVYPSSLPEEIVRLLEGKNPSDNNGNGGEDLDIEKDIVIRMQPVTRQKIKIKIKDSGKAKPHIISEALLDE